MVAGVIAILAFVPYIISILRKKTKPVLATWIVFFVLNWFTVISIMNMNEQTALFVPWGFAIGASLTLGLAFVYAESYKLSDMFSKMDIICLVIASMGVTTMIITGDGTIALYSSLFAFIVGATPTVIHCLKKPEEEDALAWILFGLTAILNLMHVPNWESFDTAIYPIVNALIDVPIALIMLRAKLKGIA